MQQIIRGVLFINAIILIGGCCWQKHLYLSYEIQGDYFYKKDHNIKLSFNDDSFAYVDTRKNYDMATPCCDTLSAGNWKRDDRGFLLLNTAAWLNTFFVEFQVKEKNNPTLDTTYFYINSPIEEQYKKNNDHGSELIYNLDVSAVGGYTDYFKENSQTFETTVIKYYNPNKLSIDNFFLSISAKQSMFVKNLAVRDVSTFSYKVKNPSANVFEINLPKLTYGFFSYRRLNDDFVKIIDLNRLLWDGMEFIKAPH